MIRKILFLMIVLLSLLACAKESELIIHNDTPIVQKVKIDGIIFDIFPNDPPVRETYFLNSYVLWNEIVKVPVEYVPNSPISYRSLKSFTVEMKPGKDKTYHINYDRGCIQLRNLSSVRIYQMLTRTDIYDDWSDNILPVTLYPDEIRTVALKENYYSIKLIDDFGTEYPIEHIIVVAGETIMLVFTGEL